MRWLSGLVQQLQIRAAEGMTKSGECFREEVPRAGVLPVGRRQAGRGRFSTFDFHNFFAF